MRRPAAVAISILWFSLAGTVEAQTTVTFATPGTTSWTAPAGVTSATVQAWGGGGAGGGATGNPAEGGGGAGGQYASSVVAVTPGNSYSVVVGSGGTGGTGNGGAGGSSTFNGTSVVARGGAAGAGAAANRSGGAAGAGSSAGGVGSTVYAGGSGSAGAATAGGCQAGGAGGGGAGSGGAGGDASGNTGGAGRANGGGAGANASNSSGNGSAGNDAGGGGAGACAETNTNRSGGAGGDGMVTITYIPTATVVSISLAGSSPTSAASVSWTVSFSASVTGIAAGNFALVNTGLGGTPAITSVTGSGTTWTVSASTGAGSGTLGLNMVSATGVSPSVTNLPFTGQVYSIIHICSTPPWYDAAWQYRKAITIDHTKVGGTLANFPVLVSVTDANLQAGAQASGNDILFTDSSGTAKLAHEIELYTGATGQLIAWVSVPGLSASADTVIYMYYGNASAPAQQNPSAVWDANYSGVWHLKETGNGSAGEYKDSTANANNARGGNGSSAATPSRVAGKIGFGQNFNGSQLINGTSGSMPAVNGNQTMSFWYEVAANPPSTRTNFLTLRTTGGGSANQAVFVGAVSSPCLSYTSPIGATQWGGACTVDANAPVAGSWHYYVLTHSGTTNTLYMDGAQVATSTAALQTGAVGEFIWGSYDTAPAEPLTGLMDETRVSNTPRSAAWILTEYNNQSAPATFLGLGAQQSASTSCYTYYSISYPGGSTGLTCEASQVTITAKDSSNNPAAPSSGTVLSISTSTGAGVWTGLVAGAGTLSGYGANNGAASYVWAGGENSITLNLRQNTPATINVNLSDSNAKIENSGTDDPSITFANTAFRVTDAAGTAAATLGTQIAGKPSNAGFGAQTRYLQAMRTDTSTGACTTLFQSKTVSVGLAGARINPTGGASALSVQNSGGTMQAIGTGAGAAGAYTNVSLAFDAQSKAPLVVSYPDAGSVALYAQYALPSPPAGTYVSGSSNTFVVRPFGLRVSGVTTAASPSASSPVFAKAGASFNTTLTAVAWKTGDDADVNGVPDSDAQIASNAATPNFGQESTPASATLSHTLNAPAGGNAGTLGGSTTFSGFSAGLKTQAVNWSEVGFIDLHAQSANYLASGQNVSDSSAGLTGVGRFMPDHFALSGGVLTNRAAAACAPASAFSYLGEGMRLQFTLTAQSTANSTTQNYNTASGFAKLPTVPSGMGFGAVNGTTNLTSRLDLGNSGALSWSAGATSVDYTLAVNRASPDNPDGPFAAAKIGVAPSDGDGVALASAAYDIDVDNNSVNEHKQVGAGTLLLFGRLMLRNALGTKAAALSVPIAAQVWQGTAFTPNPLDSCTVIPRSAIVLDGYAGALAPGGGNCKTFVQQNPVAFSAGVGTLTLAAPTGGASGSVRLTPNLGTAASGNYCASAAGGETPASAAALGYLLGRWNDMLDPDGNASTMYDDNPSARAAFGLYGSQPDRLIYHRENY